MNVLYTDVQLRPFNPVFKILYVTSYHGSWKQVLHARRNIEGVENFPAHKTGIVSYGYSICTQRYECVKTCVCVCGDV